MSNRARVILLLAILLLAVPFVYGLATRTPTDSTDDGLPPAVRNYFENNLNEFEGVRSYVIDECRDGGDKVYALQLNAYDVGVSYIDADAKHIASCSWAWGAPDDDYCYHGPSQCRTVYAAKGNIFGKGEVDIYDLD